MSGEIGIDDIVWLRPTLASWICAIAAVSRVASAVAVRLESFSVSIAMSCVARSVSADCTE